MKDGVVKGNVELYVKDLGLGIPPLKHSSLFVKFQTSLDQLSQITGFGLCLSKQIMTIMNEDLWLDTTYDSGIIDHPSVQFEIQLNFLPIHPDLVAPFHEKQAASLPQDNAMLAGLQDHNDHTKDMFSAVQIPAATDSTKTRPSSESKQIQVWP